MRDIRFRAWDDASMDMLQDVGFHPHIAESHDDGSFTITPSIGRWHIMQYTGLKDKNGTDVYEGDIVSRGQGKPWVIGGGLSFCQDVADMERFLQRGDPYEVIGNIWENGDLLK